jgi:transposase
MNLKQLDFLNKSCRGKKDSIAYLAAKLVLVDGLANNDAEKRLNATSQSVSNGISRYKALDAEVREAYGIGK